METVERLGFAAGTTVAVVHADDIGMSHAANVGAFAALDTGPATCGSVMVPCPWSIEAAEMAQARPNVDLGVHLTLNAESSLPAIGGARWRVAPPCRAWSTMPATSSRPAGRP